MAYQNLNDAAAMSESIEMYLLRVALLQEANEPVPVPQLAQELSISPVSAHEMCRKLTEKGLVQYEPYKGVTLTTEGDVLAQRVLRCRRLWETFFVEKLGIEPAQADEMACRFEHVTPDALAEQLAAFLVDSDTCGQMQLLTSLAAGGHGQVVEIMADEVAKEFLRHHGMITGSTITVVAVAADGSVLLDVAGQHLSLSQMLAKDVKVILISQPEFVNPD